MRLVVADHVLPSEDKSTINHLGCHPWHRKLRFHPSKAVLYTCNLPACSYESLGGCGFPACAIPAASASTTSLPPRSDPLSSRICFCISSRIERNIVATGSRWAV